MCRTYTYTRLKLHVLRWIYKSALNECIEIIGQSDKLTFKCVRFHLWKRDWFMVISLVTYRKCMRVNENRYCCCLLLPYLDQLLSRHRIKWIIMFPVLLQMVKIESYNDHYISNIRWTLFHGYKKIMQAVVDTLDQRGNIQREIPNSHSWNWPWPLSRNQNDISGKVISRNPFAE